MSGDHARFAHVAAALAAATLVSFTAAGSAYGADAAAGRQKAQPCTACHGPNGNSTNPAIPSLAAQPAQFIETQLFMFREGRRKDAQMSPMAVNLTNADMRDLAAFFSAQQHAPPAHSPPPDKVAAGRKLTQQNNCVQCHGPQLKGQQHIPRLAGQQLEYLRTQLRGFKASTRFDMDGVMTSAAQALSPADIDLLAEYLASLN